MTVDEIRSIFSRWDGPALQAAGIDFKETFDPPPDSSDDYRVIYEVSFVPRSLDQTRIEFWVTDYGKVAVGVETYARVKKRSGLKTWREGFALGHEPTTATRNGLQILFDVVAAGRFCLVAGSIFRIMPSLRANMYASDIEAMKQSGYSPSYGAWRPSPIPEGVLLSSPVRGARVLEYRPW